MDDPVPAAFQHFIMDLVVDLTRRGVIPRELLERMADFDDTRDGSIEEAKAMMAAGVLIEAGLPARSKREQEADFRRRQMRERTTLYERQRGPDGGNDAD